MPVYLSLMCWRPAVIRPPSVRDSAEKLSSGLQLESVGSKEKGSAADSTDSPSTGDFEEEANEPKQNGEDGKDSAQHLVTAEIGIQNKALTTDDEKEAEANTTAEDNIQKDTNDEHPDKVENREELARTPEKTDTHTNEEVTTSAPDSKPEDPIPEVNSSEDTARASKDTDASKDRESVANKNKKQDSTHIPFGKDPQVALVSITQL